MVLSLPSPAVPALASTVVTWLWTIALFSGIAVGFVAPALAAAGLPRLGVDWDPTGYGPGTWALLVAAGLWYALVAAVPLVALAIGMALPGGY